MEPRSVSQSRVCSKEESRTKHIAEDCDFTALIRIPPELRARLIPIHRRHGYTVAVFRSSKHLAGIGEEEFYGMGKNPYGYTGTGPAYPIMPPEPALKLDACCGETELSSAYG